jgi:hypothetical protein
MSHFRLSSNSNFVDVKGSKSYCATYTELISDIWFMFEWLIDRVVGGRWTERLQLGIVFIFWLDCFLQPTSAAQPRLLLLEKLDELVLVLENPSKEVL